MDFLSQLTVDALYGTELPANQFFVPTEVFLEFIDEELSGKLVVEVGCGSGDLLKIMHEKGVKAMGIDPCTRVDTENFAYIMPLDAGGYDYPPDTIVIMARPCHDEWIGRTINRALRHDSNTFYYIGLVRNLEKDLYGYDYDLILEDVGEEGENLYKVELFEV